jgi:hypothetical protein
VFLAILTRHSVSPAAPLAACGWPRADRFSVFRPTVARRSHPHILPHSYDILWVQLVSPLSCHVSDTSSVTPRATFVLETLHFYLPGLLVASANGLSVFASRCSCGGSYSFHMITIFLRHPVSRPFPSYRHLPLLFQLDLLADTIPYSYHINGVPPANNDSQAIMEEGGKLFLRHNVRPIFPFRCSILQRCPPSSWQLTDFSA